MMLRTLPARSGFLWVLLACIFLAGCTRHPKYSLQTEAVLERLDAELSRKDRYQQWRQAQNDSLRREVARARNAGDRVTEQNGNTVRREAEKRQPFFGCYNSVRLV